MASGAWKAGEAERVARRADEYKGLQAWWAAKSGGGTRRIGPLSAADQAKKERMMRLKAKAEGTWKGSAGQKARRKKKFGTDSPNVDQRAMARANARNQGTAGMVGKPAGGKPAGGNPAGGNQTGGHAEGSRAARAGHQTMRERYMKRKAEAPTKIKTKHRLSIAR